MGLTTFGYPATTTNDDQQVAIRVDPAVFEGARNGERNNFY